MREEEDEEEKKKPRIRDQKGKNWLTVWWVKKHRIRRGGGGRERGRKGDRGTDGQRWKGLSLSGIDKYVNVQKAIGRKELKKTEGKVLEG